MRKGVPISPGVVVARAYCVDEALARREPLRLEEAALSAEVSRFDTALSAAGKELDGLANQVRRQLGDDEAAIFRGQRLLLRDPSLITKVKTAILEKRIDASSALHEALEEYAALFAQIHDPYLKERMADVRDVISRLVAKLAANPSHGECLTCDEPVVLVATEVLPSQAMAFRRLKIAGIVTETGGPTGHAAILARSLGIPSIAGLAGVCREVATGDLLAVDGRQGHVHIRPDPETEAAYRKLQREYFDLRDRLVIENRAHQAVTRDGAQVELLANVNGPADAEMAVRTGATGVGLYRTEYLFLTHATVPSEEEQLAEYKAVIEAAPCKRVTIRTLDLGGDKVVPYMGERREANPFMGWRSIRLTTAYPEFFQTQLRAILRAGLYGEIRILFPMVTTLEEVHNLKELLEGTKAKLRRDGIPFADKMPVGIMLEVPAAALCVGALLPEVDFVSIGSNDLTQYLMAADRDNPKVAHLCEPFSPPVLRLLRHVLKVCGRHGKPVTLCGEMAGRPRCFLPLFGMGLRQLSMSPAFVPTIKELVRNSTVDIARKVARRALRLTTFHDVRNFLTRATRRVCPNVSLLDTRN
ncbi:MAG: phosphoenolpyruvate--protein phosphotransferase [Planctomycetes bacterium]|nr:phosphoenolpyruvate--protein phosphotransferase [Planctomycetota bacterium]